MYATLKDFLTASFYILGAALTIGLIFFMGIIVIIPAMFYGTYHILRIRREMRQAQEHSHASINYTTSDNHRTKPHKDR